MIWNSNFGVHKVLQEHTQFHPFTQHRWLLWQRQSWAGNDGHHMAHKATGFTIWPFTLCWPLTQKTDKRKETRTMASVIEQTSWNVTWGWTRAAGKRDGESRAGSGPDISNQQDVWRNSKVMSVMISGFSSEQPGSGQLSPPEREEAGQMLEGCGARDHSSGKMSWRQAGYTWAGNGGWNKHSPTPPLYTKTHKSLFRGQIWTLFPQQMNEYFEPLCSDILSARCSALAAADIHTTYSHNSVHIIVWLLWYIAWGAYWFINQKEKRQKEKEN